MPLDFFGPPTPPVGSEIVQKGHEVVTGTSQSGKNTPRLPPRTHHEDVFGHCGKREHASKAGRLGLEKDPRDPEISF